jgi:hypothetical protein
MGLPNTQSQQLVRPVIDLGPESYAGPVARAYELSLAPVAVIIGPTGGGKSQASARRIIRVALNQYPSPRDGIRKARIVVVCPTYRRAWDTVIPSYLKVWPETLGKLKGGKGDPADHIIDIPYGEHRLHLEIMFRAVRDESLEDFVRGLETTAWWFPEMDTMPAEDLLSLASNRVGRYPEPDDRPDLPEGSRPAYAGVWGDANAPVIGGWFHERFYLQREAHKATDVVFRQPAGMLADRSINPRAENLQNLRKIRPDYYPNLASTMADYDVGRLLMCKPGWSRHGKPVHEHFDDATMIAPHALIYDPRLPLLIGADAGPTLKPAALFAQRSFTGEIRILAEINPRTHNTDLMEFGAEIRRMKDVLFPLCKEAVIFADPAMWTRSALNGQMTYAQLLSGQTGMEVRPAPTQDPGRRRTAVDQVMKRKVGMTYLVDPGCTGLIEAWSGGYRFKKVGNVYSPLPDKQNGHSDIADAAQYLTLGIEGEGGQGGFIPPHADFGQDGASPILPS